MIFWRREVSLNAASRGRPRVLAMIGPEESAHGEVSLVGQVTSDGQAILSKKAIKLPLGHGHVVLAGVPGVMEWHLKAAHSTLLLPLNLIHLFLLSQFPMFAYLLTDDSMPSGLAYFMRGSVCMPRVHKDWLMHLLIRYV